MEISTAHTTLHKCALNSVIGGIAIGTKSAASHSLENAINESTEIFEKPPAQRKLPGQKHSIAAGITGSATIHGVNAAVQRRCGPQTRKDPKLVTRCIPGAVMRRSNPI